MTLKNDAKFDEELTCALKNDVEGFGELWRNTQNLSSNGLLLTKTYNVWAKKELCVYILKTDTNFEGKMTFGFINDTRNLVNFDEALKNLKICTFRDVFCPRYIMLS